MKKRMYRSIPVNRAPKEKLRAAGALTFAIDVAKADMVGAFASASGEVITTVSWTSPGQTGAVLALLDELRRGGQAIETVMEPSGTYDAPLRHQLQAAGFAVFRVQGKRTHDAREVYDGVPSLHDAKSAAILVRLHKEGVSRLWEAEDAGERELKAALSTLDLHREQLQRLQGKLEAQLARYWPELGVAADVTSATVLALLARIGGPADVAAAPAKAKKLMRGMSHRLMKDDRIEAIMHAAGSSLGVPLLPAERDALMELASEAHRSLKAFKRARLVVETLSEDLVPKKLPPVIGKATTAVVVAEVGNPASYRSARAFMKACGLNLREKSSGKKAGELHITKRGSSKVRAYLWLAALRLIRTNDLARAWYIKKVARDGGARRKKAVVALMRKLAKALYVVAAGADFDATKLFDTTRLHLPA